MNSLEKKYLERGTYKGNTLYLTKHLALEFIHESNNQGLKILGIDGVTFDMNATIPHIEHSIDLSDLSISINESYKLAVNFLLDQPDILHFEIVIDD